MKWKRLVKESMITKGVSAETLRRLTSEIRGSERGVIWDAIDQLVPAAWDGNNFAEIDDKPGLKKKLINLGFEVRDNDGTLMVTW